MAVSWPAGAGRAAGPPLPSPAASLPSPLSPSPPLPLVPFLPPSNSSTSTTQVREIRGLIVVTGHNRFDFCKMWSEKKLVDLSFSFYLLKVDFVAIVFNYSDAICSKVIL